MAGQLGTTADDVGAAIVSSTASSRFVAPSYWRDPASGVSYQVQVQVPQAKMTSLADIGNIPVGSTTGAQPLVNQLAAASLHTVPGELDRQNGLWMLALSANFGTRDLAARQQGHRASACRRRNAAARGEDGDSRTGECAGADIRPNCRWSGRGHWRDSAAAHCELPVVQVLPWSSSRPFRRS